MASAFVEESVFVNVLVRSASNLMNVKGSSSARQNPFVVVFISHHRLEYVDSVVNVPRMMGGVTVSDWNLNMRFLCEKRRLGRAVLALHLFHWGKTSDKRLGTVELPLAHMPEESEMICQVRNPSGEYQGELNVSVGVAKRRPVQREIEVCVVRAMDLKNVKPFWDRISLNFPFLRKMSPYVVAWIDPVDRKVSPTAVHGGKNPVWESNKAMTYIVDDSLLVVSEREAAGLLLTFHLYHRHKAEFRHGNLSREPTLDLMIGEAKIHHSKSTPRTLTCDVYTKRGKARGTLVVTVGMGRLIREESATPTSPSWEPRTNTACFGFQRTAPWFTAIGATAAVVSTALGFAPFI